MLRALVLGGNNPPMLMITRRKALKATALTVGALTLAPSLLKAQADSPPLGGIYPFKVPDLGYSYDALEPYIDGLTMHLHHDKHHGAYVENLNKALAEAGEQFQKMSVEELLINLDQVPENVRTTVRNNGGGHYNHTLLWLMLEKKEGGKPTGDLASAINDAFGSYADFQKKLSDAA